MQDEILAKNTAANLRVYAVWFDMMPADSRELVDRRVFNDSRVTNFYDPNRVVGTWFAQRTGAGGIVWDAYFLYGPDATWDSEPGPLVSSGSTVIGSSSDLARAFGELV